MRAPAWTARIALALAVSIGGAAACGTSVNPGPTGSPPGPNLTSGPTNPAPSASADASRPPAPTPATSWTIPAGGDPDVYRYAPSTLAVPANVPVSVRFIDADVIDHTWTVFEADGSTVLAMLSVAKEGDEATGTFTFPNPGTYEFWCTIDGHKQFGEVGTLIVTP